MNIFHTREKQFVEILERIRARAEATDEKITETVRRILHQIRTKGDTALFEYTKKFDGISLSDETVEVSADEIEKATMNISKNDFDILKVAADRIERFHRKQLPSSWSYIDNDGIELGQLIRPLDKVGIYAPGGLAVYPSTILMAAIPAKIAGVNDIILTTPMKNVEIHSLILAAAKLSGVTRIFRIGGAQAIAALAYGTKSVPRVDKIVGPGNIFVAEAKRMLFGTVGIDMIAGPSEIVVISDGTAKPSVVAADLLSQAEHDPMASAILLTPDESFAHAVAAEIREQLITLPRQEIAKRSLENFGAIIITRDMEETLTISNRLAPEHLELMTENPNDFIQKIRHAGAIFLGYYTPEAMGDYLAGPNHTLPTGGTARFSSPLGVYDFIKRSSTICFSQSALNKYGQTVIDFSTLEGLEAHGKSVAKRLNRS